LPAFNMN